MVEVMVELGAEEAELGLGGGRAELRAMQRAKG